MAEPTIPTSVTAAAIISGVAAPLLPALPILGQYSVVIVPAFAAAMVQLGAHPELNWRGSVVLMLRVVLVCLALTGAVAYLLTLSFDKLPQPVALALVSFGLGLADGNWRRIGDGLWDWLMSILPRRNP